MTDSVIDLAARRHAKDKMVLTLECPEMTQPLVRQFLVDVSLSATQVIDLLAVGMCFNPSPMTVLELHRAGYAPHYAGRSEYHFVNESLWDITEVDFAEVLKTADKLSATLQISLVPDRGWWFHLTAQTPSPELVRQTSAPFVALRPELPLLNESVSAEVWDGAELARQGKPVPPHLQVALVRQGQTGGIFTRRVFTVIELIHNYFKLNDVGLVFPWFSLLDDYAGRSGLAPAAWDLLSLVMGQGSIRILKNGRLSLPDTRALMGFSEFFHQQFRSSELAGPVGSEPANSDHVPGIRQALET